MVPASPANVLGSHAQHVRPVVVETVRSRHNRSAEAHEVSESRYATGFGTQWRDLLDDMETAFRQRGYETYKVPPAGYKLAVVNDCLVYVWRVPGHVDGASLFASSPTRRNAFSAKPPDPALFQPGFTGEPDAPNPDLDPLQQVEVTSVVDEAVARVMPLVLVMVRSSPQQLQSIHWAVAELDQESGTVRLHGQECIWSPEAAAQGSSTDVESFDSGVPNGPTVEPRRQEETPPDA